VDAAEVVEHEIQRQRVAMVLEFFGERAGQASKAAHGHSHRQILPLGEGRVDKVRVRIAHDGLLDRADALGRAVTTGPRIIVRENLVQHRVVSVEIHNRHGLQICLMAVRGELDAIGKPRLQVAHERNAGVLAAVANVPRHDQLGVGVDAGPRPYVISSLRGGLGELDVLLLRVAERPDFIALDSLAGTLRTVASWKAAQAIPASISSLDTVLIETAAIREIDRMDDPSQSMERI